MVPVPLGHAAARPLRVVARVLGPAVEAVDRGVPPVVEGGVVEEDVVAAVDVVVGVVGVELSGQWEWHQVFDSGFMLWRRIVLIVSQLCFGTERNHVLDTVSALNDLENSMKPHIDQS